MSLGYYKECICCKDRYPACSSSCEKYKKAKAEHEAEKANKAAYDLIVHDMAITHNRVLRRWQKSRNHKIS